jgi:hypothetical protein
MRPAKRLKVFRRIADQSRIELDVGAIDVDEFRFVNAICAVIERMSNIQPVGAGE